MSYTPPPPPPPMPGYGMPGGYAQPQTSQKALWAMILGILGLVCCGLFAGIPALILGNLAKKEIAASGGRLTGGGMATAGVVLGIIAIAWSVVSFVLLVTGVLGLDPPFDTY